MSSIASRIASLACLVIVLAGPAALAADKGGRFDLGGPCLTAAEQERLLEEITKHPRADELFLDTLAAQRAGDWRRVAELERESVRRMCANPFRWFQLAEAYLKAGDRQSAARVIEEVYRRGFEINPLKIRSTLDTVAEFLDSAWFRSTGIGRVIDGHLAELTRRRAAYRRTLAAMPPAERPDPRFVRKNACPFEYCPLGTWTAKTDTILLDRPEGSTRVSSIRAGEAVKAVTGEVHLEPVPVGVARPAHGFEAGEVLFVLDYVGEGDHRYWHRGRIAPLPHHALHGVSYCLRPGKRCWAETVLPEHTDPKNRKHDWWVRIETASGKTGWTKATGDFRMQNTLR